MAMTRTCRRSICGMPRFRHDDVEIAYLDEGEGEPIVLVHGFASNKEVNWVHPGWVATLTRAGRRVDRARQSRPRRLDQALRSGGLSQRRRWPRTCARCSIISASPRADVMGYSMGARIAAFLALAHPARVRSVVLGGLGIHLVDGVGLPKSIADALEAPSLADVHDPQGRMFRAFAEQTRSDLQGARRLHPRLAPDADARGGARRSTMPVLVAVGTKDDVAGSAQPNWPRCCRTGEALDIPGRDHMLAVGDKVFKRACSDFLARAALTESCSEPLERHAL